MAAVRLEWPAEFAICQELGIPAKFRPGINLNWYDRGENLAAQRRAELRKVAGTRLDAESKKAKSAIEAASVEMQTTLVAGALQSADAKELLESMPTVEALLIPLELPELESGLRPSTMDRGF